MPPPSADTIIAALSARASARNRRAWARAEVGSPLGVAVGDLRPLARELGTNHALARALWATEHHEARLLGCLIAEPAHLSAEEAEGLIDASAGSALADAVCALVCRSPLVDRLALTWSVSPAPLRARAGWGLIAHLAGTPDKVTDRWLEPFLDHIVRTADRAAPQTREAMAAVLVSTAHFRPLLRSQAVSAATLIGPLAASSPRRRWPMPDVATFIAKLLAHEVDRPAGHPKRPARKTKSSAKKNATKQRSSKSVAKKRSSKSVAKERSSKTVAKKTATKKKPNERG